VRNTNHGAPRYVIFFILLLSPPPSLTQITTPSTLFLTTLNSFSSLTLRHQFSTVEAATQWLLENVWFYLSSCTGCVTSSNSNWRKFQILSGKWGVVDVTSGSYGWYYSNARFESRLADLLQCRMCFVSFLLTSILHEGGRSTWLVVRETVCLAV